MSYGPLLHGEYEFDKLSTRISHHFNKFSNLLWAYVVIVAKNQNLFNECFVIPSYCSISPKH
jgi:hypothetical protein